MTLLVSRKHGIVELGETEREGVADILEVVAREGLSHPRHLDSALDAIQSMLDPQQELPATPGRWPRAAVVLNLVVALAVAVFAVKMWVGGDPDWTEWLLVRLFATLACVETIALCLRDAIRRRFFG